MNDEIAHQDELINKLNKEKKHAVETQAKANDDLSTAEEKMDNLNKIKTKLEVTLDELEVTNQKLQCNRFDYQFHFLRTLMTERRSLGWMLTKTDEELKPISR